MRRVKLATLLLAAVLSVVPGWAASDPFPRPEGLRPQIDFWKKIFAEISENQALIHDDVHLDKIYAVIDLPPIPEDGAGEGTIRKQRREKVDRETRQIRATLEKLHKLGGATAGLDSRERAIAELLSDLRGPRKYREASARLRTQTGLRERFKRGIEISRRYIPHMEATFRAHGLPPELTRLPLIESTFNVKAYSKVGAAGIWQFMPSSAKIYGLDIDEAVDHRRDPLLAADGAARHLRDDFEMLGAWPLAITAYNHGRGGIARAVRTVGSNDIVTIVRRYRGKSFGFASRNFYAEFVAALEIDADREKHFKDLDYEPKLRFDEVQLPAYLPFGTLVRLCDCSADTLQDLNLALLSEVIDGKLYAPAGTRLRLPDGSRQKFLDSYAKLGASERYASQRTYWGQHRVARGQSLGVIARRYGVSPAAIQRANGLRSAHRIRLGQVLKIPPRGTRAPVQIASAESRKSAAAEKPRVAKAAAKEEVQVAAVARPSAQKPSAQKVAAKAKSSVFHRHKVSRGQTVGSIARRYGTTIRAIKTHNSIGDVRKIRIGQVLRIPQS